MLIYHPVCLPPITVYFTTSKKVFLLMRMMQKVTFLKNILSVK